MKKITFLLLLSSLISHSQDTLFLKNQTKVISLVLLVANDSIRYKKIEDITGPDLYIQNSKVLYVKYKNGKSVNIDSLYQSITKAKGITNPYEIESQQKANSAEEMYKTGALHASVYYHCKGCTTGFTAASLVAGPLALIPGLITMGIMPSKKNLAYPSEDLWQNENYQKGYKHKVKKIKGKAVGAGLSIGHFLAFCAWGLILSR